MTAEPEVLRTYFASAHSPWECRRLASRSSQNDSRRHNARSLRPRTLDAHASRHPRRCGRALARAGRIAHRDRDEPHPESRSETGHDGLPG